MLRRVVTCLVLVVITMLWVAVSGAVGTRTEMAAAVELEAQRGKYQLIDVAILWNYYQDDARDLLLVDTRQEWEFRTGHIAGALHFSMEPTWFERLIQRHALAQALGPDKDRVLVFY